MIYPCYFEGIVRDTATGAPIKGASVTFVKEDKSKSWTATTSDSGRYRRELPEGRYTYIATHCDYIMQSSSSPVEVKAPYTKRVRGAGGIVREITISNERSKVVDINMNARPTTVLLVTTSLLSRTAELEGAVSRYTEVVSRKDGLSARYIVLDSEDCRAAYGVRLSNPGSWEEIRDVLQAITDETGPCYIILLGGPAVLPVPQVVNIGGSPWYLPADGWYIDFDGNGVVDEGFAVSRMPDIASDSSAIAPGPGKRQRYSRGRGLWHDSRDASLHAVLGCSAHRAWATPAGMMHPPAGSATPLRLTGCAMNAIGVLSCSI